MDKKKREMLVRAGMSEHLLDKLEARDRQVAEVGLLEERMGNDKNEAELRRLEAESHAKVDAVFEDRQKKIAQIEANAKREIDNILLSPPPGRWYHIVGSVFFLGGLGGTVAPLLGSPKIFGYIGPVLIVLGIVCWLLSNWKQDKQRNKLPPPQ